MRTKLMYLLAVFLLAGCKQQTQENYRNEPCIGMRETNDTGKFKVNDTLPGFGTTTAKGTAIALNELGDSGLFLFYKTKECPIEGFLNNEIVANGLGKLADENNVDLYILSDPKTAKYYGIYKDRVIEKSTLFVLRKDLVIQKIYQDVCEEEIAQLIKDFK